MSLKFNLPRLSAGIRTSYTSNTSIWPPPHPSASSPLCHSSVGAASSTYERRFGAKRGEAGEKERRCKELMPYSIA